MKKILLALPLLATLALVPVSTAQAEDRHPPTTGGCVWTHSHYKVFYRSCPRSPWVCQGTYDCPNYARRVASQIQYRYGYETFIRTITH